jgi:hypothetical protein
MKDKKMSMKAVVSVSEMAETLGFSRARFYQLIQAQLLPLPLYDLRTHRPFYNQELQEKCLEVRQTGIGISGQYILFYSPRKNKGTGTKSPAQKKGSKYQEFIESLAQMGLDVSDEQVSKAIADVFPDGADNIDQGLVVRDLFRYFKKVV